MSLLINLVVALALSSVGFIMYVYFFSVGYGLSVAGIALTMLLTCFRGDPLSAAMCALLLIYGLRLGGYLLYRELKNANYRRLLKSESKSGVPVGVKCCIWIACAILYTCQTCPVLFRMEAGTGADAAGFVGTALMACGIVLEIAADLQKNAAKKKNPHRFVSTGLYRLVRCPNYFGELLLWTGVLVSGLSVFHGPLEWVLALLGWVGIVYVMFSGARRLELRQDRNYGADPEYRAYASRVPILIPFVPLYSVKKYGWLKA